MDLRKPVLGLTTTVLFAWCPPSLAADENQKAAAQVLFERGRDLLRANKTGEACPLLAESQRLDPANGTLLALAMCHEAEGKLATASKEFTQVAELTKRAGQGEREALARQRIAALAERVSTLEVRVHDNVRQAPNLRVIHNGEVLLAPSWNAPLPVDGGEHRVSAMADGYETWNQTVRIPNEAAHEVVNITELQLAPAREPVPAQLDTTPPRVLPPASHSTPARLSEPRDPEPEGWTDLQVAGLSSAGLGLSALLAGAVTLYSALDTYAKADECSTDSCRRTRQIDAVRLGNWSTGLGIGGAALLLGGSALVLWGGTDDSNASKPALSLRVPVTECALQVTGTF